MYVKQLKIQAFRGIESLDLEFQPGINVLIGVNGVGKSSILDCLVYLASQISPPYQTPLPDENLIKIGCDQMLAEISMILDDNQQGTWGWKVHRNPLLFPNQNIREDDNQFVQLFNQQIGLRFRQDPETSIPLVAYYPSRRNVPLRISLDDSELSELFPTLNYQALESRQIDFSDFFSWFKITEDLENENRLQSDPNYRDPCLETVRKAIMEFLPGFSHMRVRRTTHSIVVSKHDQELAINQLSDGEKSLLALVADIARRLSIHNRGLLDPLKASGVILIDEVDAHLHPQWQRRIISSLRRAFPNCQFILATHSPLLISDVPAENIHLLSQVDGRVVANHPDVSLGRDANQILELVMGVTRRPEKNELDLRSLFRLIDDGDLDAARNLKRHLEQEIGLDEPEFAKADVMIRRKEILGR